MALISLERTSYLFEISLKMLVLALQFSRSHLNSGTARARRLEQLDAAVRGNDSLKTEEKTVAGDTPIRERDRIPATSGRCGDSPPVHQQVCLVLGGTNVHLQ